VSRPRSTRDLSPTERQFVLAMRELGFGHFEFLRIERGELVLDPWPTTVRSVKFGKEPWSSRTVCQTSLSLSAKSLTSSSMCAPWNHARSAASRHMQPKG